MRWSYVRCSLSRRVKAEDGDPPTVKKIERALTGEEIKVQSEFRLNTGTVKYEIFPIWVFCNFLVCRLTHLCPGKDYQAVFYNFLQMNPSDDQMKKSGLLIFLRKNVQERTCGHKWVKREKKYCHFIYCKTGNFHVQEIFVNFGRFGKFPVIKKPLYPEISLPEFVCTSKLWFFPVVKISCLTVITLIL